MSRSAMPPVPRPGTATTIRWLAMAAVALGLADLTIEIARYGTGHDRLFGLYRLFNLGHENNVPTWFSSGLLLLCGLVATAIAVAHHRRGDGERSWVILAAALGFMSLDEMASIHERLTLASSWFESMPVFTQFTWIVAGTAFTVMVALGVRSLLARLPGPIRRGFLRGSAIYLGGAIGVELLSGLVAVRFGQETFAYAMVDMVEELMEMFGAIVILNVFLTHLRGFGADSPLRLATHDVAAALATGNPGRAGALQSGPRDE